MSSGENMTAMAAQYNGVGGVSTVQSKVNSQEDRKQTRYDL